jgi:hypothetical protein
MTNSYSIAFCGQVEISIAGYVYLKTHVLRSLHSLERSLADLTNVSVRHFCSWMSLEDNHVQRRSEPVELEHFLK